MYELSLDTVTALLRGGFLLPSQGVLAAARLVYVC